MPGQNGRICHVLTIIEGSTEEVVDAFKIEKFDLRAFCQQFDVPVESDPQMLDRYSVGPDDLPFLENALTHRPAWDLARYAYFIEAVLEDW